MDLDDLDLGDAPNQAAARKPSRFQPKSSKLKPKPIQEPKSEPLSDPQPKPLLAPKQEDIKPDIGVETKVEPMLNPVEEDEEDELNGDPMEEDNNDKDENDYVVREIDVYCTPPLDNNTQLYVMQYPLKPHWRRDELNEKRQEIRVKPKSSKFEVDLAINMDQNYDENVDDKFMIQKQTLASTKPPLTTGYAIGVLKGTTLHLNPIHAAVQLRPSMEYLDPSRSKKKAGTQNALDTTKSAEFTEEVSVGPSKKQGDAPLETDESWVSLVYHDENSDLSATYIQKMTSQQSSPIQFSMSPGDYLNTLYPALSTEKDGDKSLSKRILRLPLDKRFNKWFSEGPQVNRFSFLKHLAPEVSDENILLEVIHQSSLLVQGLWVSRSSLLHLESSDAIARDYVLYLFKNDTLISNKKLQEHPKYQERMKKFMLEFAVFRPSFQNWKFKEPTDVSFIKDHQDVVQKQEKNWEIQEKNLMKVLKSATSGTTVRKSSNPNVNKPRTSVNADLGTRVTGTPGSGTVTMSDEAREAMTKALEGLLRKQSVCSWKLICENLREDALLRSSDLRSDARGAVARAREADTYPELEAVISQLATGIHGVYVLKSLGDPTLDPLRSVVIDLFCAKEPNAKLKKADITEAAKIRLKRDINSKEYQQVVGELCVSVKGNAWMLRSGDGTPPE